ncbi:MAG: methylmalonyl Co-A mutase-associated GTPase MeaB [Candidatus Eremiobacteraeota bacterium]|nr:methylmalonyl Co-A mutase-associated GTPase MeaB [Candidatus Eremiobacteraeota bacterium]
MGGRAANYAERILAGERLAAARAITLVENGSREAWELMTRLGPHLGRAFRIGVTGPPGAGKSTLVDALACRARELGETVGVVAVDPSSPFSGGALLGDRVRMARSLADPEVFVRSMASRGCLGGLARTTQEAADILDALGKSVIFIETVGVGQSELAVAGACDCTLVVMVPEAGGVIQAMKAGLMEVADLFAVNKSDRPGAEEMRLQLVDASRYLIDESWRPPVVAVTAVKSEGIEELFDQLLRRRKWLQEGDRLEKKRLEQSASRIRELVRAGLEERLWSDPEIERALRRDGARLRAGEIGLFQAAVESWERIRERLAGAELEESWRR